MRGSGKFVQKQAQLTKLISVKTVVDVLGEQVSERAAAAAAGKQIENEKNNRGDVDAATLGLLQDLYASGRILPTTT